MSSCPLTYSSGNAPHKRDVLGTWFLSILAGHHRYAHITALRSDGVSPQILGMSKIISEDALRRALARMSSDESQNWLRPQLLSSVPAALNTPWILDIDTTIKTLFGKQSGADVSYNPHKPGRPSHALHTYFVSHLRMVLDVVVSPGKQHAAAHARPGLSDVLDSLSKDQLPALVRGDCGFGNEPFIAELETRGQPYLFKLRQTSGVKKMLMRQFARKDWMTPGPSDQGWSAVEDTLKLTGWDKSRRVVILRRAARSAVALTRKAAEGQMELLLPDQDVEVWEYAVLVTNSGYPLVIGRRALALGFESTIGIIHDGSGQLKPLLEDEAKVYFEMTDRKKTNYAQFDQFQEAIAAGKPNDWRCRSGSRYLYICEDGLVHYCSQQRGYPGVPLAGYTTADVKRELVIAKSCAPNCTIGCVHRISHIDYWRAPQTSTIQLREGEPASPAKLVKIQLGG